MATDKPLQAGDLDRRADLMRYDEHRDTMGSIGRSLSVLTPGIYCKKDEQPGKETEADDRVTAYGQVVFTIRYRQGIDETMLWQCDGVLYDIKNVREGPGRRQWLVLICQRHN